VPDKSLMSAVLSRRYSTYHTGEISRADIPLMGVGPHVGSGCVLCTRIDALLFLAGCRRRRLNQGLVVAVGFFSRC